MTDQPAAPAPPVPAAAWALAWSCLADQVLLLGERGTQSSAVGMLVSAVRTPACLAWFTTTEYFAWQRSRPQATATGIRGLILVAVLVGALGGVIGTPEDAPVRFQINV